jgi:hypothetical protein
MIFTAALPPEKSQSFQKSSREPATVLDCGGKRSTTPLSPARRLFLFGNFSTARKRCRRCALPAQSKTRPETSKALAALNLKPALEAKEHTTDGMIAALLKAGK